MRQTKNSYGIFVRKSRGKLSLGRPKRNWKDDIKV
jgi:hypothetical protein